MVHGGAARPAHLPQEATASDSIHSTRYVKTTKNAVLYYLVPLDPSASGAARRAIVTNHGVYHSSAGCAPVLQHSTTIRDRDVTLTFDGRGLVTAIEDHGPLTVTFSKATD